MGASGDRADGAGNLVQRLIVDLSCGVLVVLFALGMLGGTVAANEYIPREAPIPQSIRWQNATPTGANTSASAAWMNGAGQTTHHRFPVHVSAGSLGALANGAIRRGLPLVGWGLTLKSAVEAAGWAIDELQQQVMTPGREQPSLGPQGWCHYATTWTCFNSVADVREYVDRAYVDHQRALGRVAGPLRTVELSSTSYNLIGDHPNGTSTSNWVVHYRSTNNATNGYPDAIPRSAVSNEDLGQLIKNMPQVVNGVLVDPQTGAPIRTPELAAAVNALGAALAAANGLPPPPALDPSDDLSAPVPSQSEWPGFCDWATPVCDFVDWFKADEGTTKDLPEHQLQIDPNSWSSGIGGGSCPAPIVESWVFMDTPARFEFDYQPVCDFATLMRPFLITCAVLCGAFIMAGLRSSGGK